MTMIRDKLVLHQTEVNTKNFTSKMLQKLHLFIFFYITENI